MANSKVVLKDGTVLLDISGDTVEASNLLKGFSAHGSDGEPVGGACSFDVDSSGATVKAAEILLGKTAGVGGKIITGTMPNNGAVTVIINEKDGQPVIPAGFHDGSGKAVLDPTEKQKLIPENIREGVEILGVTGNMSGTEDAKPQAKEVTPSFTEQTVLPDAGYNYLSQVKVAAIPIAYADNAAGGTTVTIG